MRKHWRLSHRLSDQAWTMHLSEEPEWTHVVESAWNVLCTITRGWAGGHGQSRLYNVVVWHVPVGRPRRSISPDGEPWLENSLGSFLYRLENWALTRPDSLSREVVEIAVSEDVARQIDEEFVEDMLSLFSDEASGADLAGQVRRVEQ